MPTFLQLEHVQMVEMELVLVRQSVFWVIMIVLDRMQD